MGALKSAVFGLHPSFGHLSNGDPQLLWVGQEVLAVTSWRARGASTWKTNGDQRL